MYKIPNQNMRQTLGNRPSIGAGFFLALCLSSLAVGEESSSIETKLDWLKSPLSCEVFLEEVRSRYGKVGDYSQLGPVMKQEIREVLEISCSDRFRDCGFANCAREPLSGERTAREAEESLTPEQRAMVWENRLKEQKRVTVFQKYSKALSEYDSMYEEKVRKQKENISEKLKSEAESNLAWQQFDMPDLERKRKKPRKPAPPTFTPPVFAPSGTGTATGPGVKSPLLNQSPDPRTLVPPVPIYQPPAPGR